MPELSRSQIVVYAALAVVALLLGARWIRSSDGAASDGGGVAYAGDTGFGGGSKAFDVSGEAGDVVVHVAGEVKRPGVYRLPGGSRVTDAVERAGGTTGDAAENAINLAARIADGQQVVVPASAPDGGGGSLAAPGAAENGPISLGTATAEALDTIEGIGPTTAQDILDYRTEHGGVGSIDELDEISGIGPATMKALRDRLQP